MPPAVYLAKYSVFFNAQILAAKCGSSKPNIGPTDFAGAAQPMGKAVEFRRTVSQLPQLDGPHKHHALAKALQEYSVALWAAGEVDAATGAFDESGKIQQKTGIAIPMPGTA